MENILTENPSPLDIKEPKEEFTASEELALLDAELMAISDPTAHVQLFENGELKHAEDDFRAA